MNMKINKVHCWILLQYKITFKVHRNPNGLPKDMIDGIESLQLSTISRIRPHQNENLSLEISEIILKVLNKSFIGGPT